MIIIPTLHPLQLVRTRGQEKGLAKFEQTVIRDLAKGVRLLSSLPSWDESGIWTKRDASGAPCSIFPTEQDVYEFFRDLPRAVSEGAVLGCDVETTGESPLACRLLCVGLGYYYRGECRLLCIPFLQQGGWTYWSADVEVRIREQLRWALGQSWIPKVFHNGSFDTSVLWAHGLQVGGWAYDTMQAHHVIDGELPHNLGYVGSLYLDTRYWKDDVKGAEGWLNLADDVLRSYNLRDVKVTLDVMGPLHARVVELGLWELYAEEIALCHIMTRATIRGIALDYNRRDNPNIDPDTGKPIGLGPQLHIQLDDALMTLRQLAGSSTFDPMKPQQLRDFLFTRMGLPVVKYSRKSGLPQVDKEALMLLALGAETDDQRAALRGIVVFRQARKFLSDFVEGLAILGDGRLHPSWKLLPVTGRWSSSPNAQNFSKKIKSIFRAGPGMMLTGVDLSQAELRYVGYLADETTLLEMYDLNVNVHTVNAGLLFQLKCPPQLTDNTNPQTDAYLQRACQDLLGLDYSTFPVVPKAQWKQTRTLAKNHEFGKIYRGENETVHRVIRSKRDPESSELLFPDITLTDIEALDVVWKKKLRPRIVKWWDEISYETKQRGYYQCPISGRIRWYRGGFKATEMANNPVQTGIGSWMNKGLLKIQRAYDAETGGAAQVIQQVHDAVNAEVPIGYEKRAGEIMVDVLSETFPLRGYTARLPADTPTISTHLDEI